ncbi:MAG: hypothetical protein ABIG11_08780 [bacterium]
MTNRASILTSILILIFALPPAFGATAEESKVYTPYFNMTLSEAMFVPSKGDFFSGGNMDTQVGMLAKFDPINSLFGLYNFKYAGPAFQPQDGKQFQERSLSHGFNFEYRRSFRDSWRVRPGIAYTKEYRRTGANEAWANGLYNMNSLGGQLALDYEFDWRDKKGMLTLQYLMRGIAFPNYTDLLREFQQAGAASELSGGLQDQTLHQISLRPAWNNFFGGFSYSWQSYKNERVIEASGVYGDTAQKDTNTTLDFGLHHTLWVFEMAPNIAWTMHRSNQNFLRFKYFGDTTPAFIAKNYDYNQLDLTVPLDLLITKKWAVSGAIQLTKRDYTDRAARDSENNYNSNKQSNLLTSISGGIRKRLNDVAMVRLNYTFVVGKSNNHFERYLPYNYTGQHVGIAYQLSY